jgi:hypothetical protein
MLGGNRQQLDPTFLFSPERNVGKEEQRNEYRRRQINKSVSSGSVMVRDKYEPGSVTV